MDTTSLILAAAEGGHTNPLVPDVNELIWGAISFFIFLAIMSKLVFPKIGTALIERTEKIEGNLEKAASEREQAQALLREYEVKLEQARIESQKLIEQARTNADRLEAELRTKAEAEAERIISRARESIAAERERTAEQLRTEVGSLAVELASRIVGDELNKDRHVNLIDRYVNELQAQKN